MSQPTHASQAAALFFALPAAVFHELRLAQAELNCHHEQLALAAVERAAQRLLAVDDSRLLDNIAELNQAMQQIRRHDAAAALLRLDATRRSLPH